MGGGDMQGGLGGSLDSAGSHERAWVAAGGLALTVAGLDAAMVLAPECACCPVLLVPAASVVPRDIWFGWARTELGVLRCGWVVSDLRLRQLVLNRDPERAWEDVA